MLYTTGLYGAIHQYMFLSIIIHVHVFFVGYLFTASIVYFDPVSHRFSYKYRASILILAFTGHSILSKMIYASPPPGVPLEQAHTGSLIMYYGGDAIELLLVVIFCYQWSLLSDRFLQIE